MISLNKNPLSFFARLALFGALSMGLSLGLASCSEEKKEETKEVVRPVKIFEVSNAHGGQKLIYSGAVKARVETGLGFRVAGKIVARSVNIGDRVKAGDVLARIDPTDYLLSARTAEANLAAAEKGVATADLANKRAQQLYEKNATAKSQSEQAALNYEQAVSSRDAAASALEQALNQVTYTELKSDRDGIVTAISADTGAVVAAGTPVATVALDSEKEIQIAVPENDIAQFSTGKTVKASFWSDTALELEGRVREVSGSADPQSRTFAVRVSLPANDNIRLGMTATVETIPSNTTGALSVPLAALAEQEGRKIVWTVDPQTSTVHAREITVSDFTTDGVNIAKGLANGDLVVVAGTQFMTENLKVKLPQNATAETGSTQAVR